VVAIESGCELCLWGHWILRLLAVILWEDCGGVDGFLICFLIVRGVFPEVANGAVSANETLS
jgi:hypothetical protein